jgi:Putative DNA-binding domain
MQHSDWQDDFADALLKPFLPVPRGLVSPSGEFSPKRFAVYRNNVVSGLIEALRDAFPVAHRIVGTEFFDAMARVYVAHDPPRSPVLLEYGSRFADFVEDFEPCGTLPYLSDVCRIERAWLEAYHAQEAFPIDPRQLEAISPTEIPGLRLMLHPSVRLLRSRFPALTIWKTNLESESPVPIPLDCKGEDILIARPSAVVEIRGLYRGGMDFVQALATQASILRAAEIALSSDPEFSLSNALGGLIGSSLVVNYYAGPDRSTKQPRGDDDDL